MSQTCNIICYIPHAIKFILCALVVIVAADNARLIVTQRMMTFMKQVAGVVILFQIMTILVFIVNHAYWVVSNHDSIVGEVAQVGWLAYDYLNKLFHLSVAILANALLRSHALHGCALYNNYCSAAKIDAVTLSSSGINE